MDFYDSEAGKTLMLGLEEENHKRMPSALAYFTEVIRLAPGRPEGYRERGLAYEILGRDENALKDYDEAIRLNPQDPTYYMSRGVLLTNLGHQGDAERDCQLLTKLDPEAGKSLCGYVMGRRQR